MTKLGLLAMVATIIGTAVAMRWAMRSDDPLIGIAIIMIGLIGLGVLLAVYVLDAAARAYKAARQLRSTELSGSADQPAAEDQAPRPPRTR